MIHRFLQIYENTVNVAIVTTHRYSFQLLKHKVSPTPTITFFALPDAIGVDLQHHQQSAGSYQNTSYCALYSDSFVKEDHCKDNGYDDAHLVDRDDL